MSSPYPTDEIRDDEQPANPPRKQSRALKTLVLSLGKTLSTAARIIIAMILSRMFVKSEYATYRQTILVFSMAIPFLGMGLSNALYFFMPNAKDRARSILVENLLMLMVFGTLMMLFIVMGGNEWLALKMNNPALATTLLVACPLALLRLPTSSVAPTMLTYERADWAAGFSTLNGVLILVFVVIATSDVSYPNGRRWRHGRGRYDQFCPVALFDVRCL